MGGEGLKSPPWDTGPTPWLGLGTGDGVLSLSVHLLRVKTAVVRKEESMSSLRKQYEVSEGGGQPRPPRPSGCGSAPGRSQLSLSCALLQAAVQRADRLEALLEQQRKQLLANN